MSQKTVASKIGPQQPTRAESAQTGTTRQLLPGPWYINALAFFGLFAATLAIYAGDLQLSFFKLDDPEYVLENPWIRGVSIANLRHILGVPYAANYSPVHLLSYMLDYAAAGPDGFAFHLSSNIWAGLVAGFAFLVGLAVTGRRIIALVAAALFVVHPAHVEAVAWISSRKDLVAAAFALPSLLAYLQYRRGGPKAFWWYGVSLILFLFSLAGKLSVATFPAVLLAWDMFVEKRPLVRSLADKIPFLLAAGFIALVAASAQPPTGNRPNAYILCAALLQNLWLLSGFGSYVIYRVPPEPSVGAGLQLAAGIGLLLAFAAPLLLRRRWPIAMVLVYWILLAFIPSQVLSFVHPVTDRYMFFPSVPALILIAWGAIGAGERLGRVGLVAASVLLVGVALAWGSATVAYLAEWRDPRSVWFAAARKSPDPDVYNMLGGHYLNIAERLGLTPRGARIPKPDARKIASAIWAGDSRLEALLAEWRTDRPVGPVELAFQRDLWALAWDAFENALRLKGTRALPTLYYRRGSLLLDQGQLQAARREFLNALEENSRSTVTGVREEVMVNSHNALGVIAAKEDDYREALRYYRMVEEEQARFGGNWVSNIAASRERVEAFMALLPSGSSSGKADDPEICYSLGVRFLDAAGQLDAKSGKAPIPSDKAQRLANDVWPGDARVPALLSELTGGQPRGPITQAFQNQLKVLAWDAFERALRAKGTRVMPSLYFRRGMTLAERGDLQAARNEFLAALDEAARDTATEVSQENTVVSHDALGVLAWRAGNYREALSWFVLAEEEQTRFGGRWVSDLGSKRKTMEEMVAKLPAADPSGARRKPDQ